MPEEILNIEYHTKRLFIKALNKYPTMDQAAAALGVSTRQVNRWKIEFGVIKTQQYIFLNDQTKQHRRSS